MFTSARLITQLKYTLFGDDFILNYNKWIYYHIIIIVIHQNITLENVHYNDDIVHDVNTVCYW